MSKCIAVFGAGPALGRAVAHHYAREGYAVIVVARRVEMLNRLASDLADAGAQVHAIAADLSDTGVVDSLAERIRALVGEPDVLYYGAAANGFTSAVDLTPQRARDLMPLGVYTPLALIQTFLPAMLARSNGAILTAQGASAVHGMPHIAGGLALAAQRNYLQALHAEVVERGVFVGGLYIGAVIEQSAFYAQRERARAAGVPVPDLPTVDPAHLAELLWTMQDTKSQAELTYPEHILGH